MFGPFDATTPYSIPWPNSQESFHAPLGPFGPYGPYPLSEATPARTTENTTTVASNDVANQTLPLGTSATVNESLHPAVESRLIAEGIDETVPIDVEDENVEDEDYEDVADDQDDDDNEEENDANDEDDDGDEEVEQEESRSVPLLFDRTQSMIVEVPFSNQPSAEAATNAIPDTAFEAIPELPDGVDPSFLAALPQEMREEVLAEHIR